MSRLMPHALEFAADSLESSPHAAEAGDRTVRLRIVELEGQLVRARSLGASRISESCKWQRALEQARANARDWVDKAAIARVGGRDDLAAAALERATRHKHHADHLKEQIDAALPHMSAFESMVAKIEYALCCLKQRAE